MSDKTISSVWIWISDEGGNKALEIFYFDPPIQNPIGEIQIYGYAFYEDVKDGSKKLYCKQINKEEEIKS